MKGSSLILTLLSEHIQKIDEKILKNQETNIESRIREKYGGEIKSNMSIAEVFALNERIEPSLLGKSSMVHGMTRVGSEYSVKLFNYRCPLAEAAENMPEVCDIVLAYFKALTKTCGWEIKEIKRERDPNTCDYTMRLGRP
jgi:predicted ArsR family transcriptional regulator